MSKSPLKVATREQKLQFDFILAKLELILANPLAKVSVAITVGNVKVATNAKNGPKASKETILKETLSLQTSLYEDPRTNSFQEKPCLIEVFLSNSKNYSNLIGSLKLDLSLYTKSSGIKLETMPLQKSPEYQGKLVFGINCAPAPAESGLGEEDERGNAFQGPLEPGDSVSQRELSDIGKGKRSVTPKASVKPLNNPATAKLMNAVDRMLMKNTKSIDANPEEIVKREPLVRKSTNNVSADKIMGLFNPVLNKTNNVISEYTNDEKAKLEKVIFALKNEKKNVESLVNTQEQRANEYVKEYEDLKEKYQALEKDHYRLKQEKEALQLSYEQERRIVESFQNEGNSEKIENVRQNDTFVLEKRLGDVIKENESLIEQKHSLENVITKQKKQIEESGQKVFLTNTQLSTLKKKNEELNDTLDKRDRQIKTLIEEINRSKNEGTAESFLDKSDKLKILEEENKRMGIKIDALQKSLDEKSKLLSETKDQLEKSVDENKNHKKHNEQLNQNIDNLKKILEQKNKDLDLSEDLRQEFLKTKQHFADVVNLVFSSQDTKIIEELDKILTNEPEPIT